MARPFLSALAAAALAAVVLSPAPARAQADPLDRASELVRQGRYELALEPIEARLARDPKNARARFLKGVVLAEQRKSAEAIRLFTELTQEFPELPEPYNNLAVLYAAQGDYQKARTALEMAIRAHPGYAVAHENLGDLYAKLASQAYEKALQLDGSNRAARTKLNLIRELFSETRRADERGAGASAAGIALAAAADAASARAPAEKSASASSAPAAGGAGEREVLQALAQWAKARSENDVEGYLAHYDESFRPPRGLSRAQWEAERRDRIAHAGRIRVAIESPKVVFEAADRATVTFRERYDADASEASAAKTLEMVKTGGRWRIREERTGG
jgi:Flp pilus assembly protein TadD